MSVNKVIVLAAGKGTRMASELPKVLAPLNGKPMIAYLIEEIIVSGVCDRPIIVVSPDNKNIIKKALVKFDCDYAIQKEQLGTGHAFACGREFIGPEVDNLIGFYGDHPFVKKESIRKLVNEHNDVLTMMTLDLENFDGFHHNFYHWGRILRDDFGKIKEIVEFKDASDIIKENTEVNPGFYCFDSNWLWKNIDKLKNNNNQKEYYLTDLVKMAVLGEHKIDSLNIPAYEAIGVNSKEDLELAEKIINNKLGK